MQSCAACTCWSCSSGRLFLFASGCGSLAFGFVGRVGIGFGATGASAIIGAIIGATFGGGGAARPPATEGGGGGWGGCSHWPRA